MELRGKQKAFLKKEAHHLQPVLQIGKSGLNEESLRQIDEALEKRELIKITLLQNASIELEEAAEQIKTATEAEIIQKIGRVMVLFRPSSKEKNQKISKDLREL